MNAHDEIANHRVPCGPVTVAASAVCRRRLRDSFDRLLDRLTEEIHPEYTPPELPKEHKFDKEGNIVHKDELARRDKVGKTLQKGKEKAKKEREKHAPLTPEQVEAKKEKMIQEGQLKLDIKKELKDYEEKLMGNSKLLHGVKSK